MSFALVWGVTYNDCKKYIPDGPVTSQTAKPFTFYHQLGPQFIEMLHGLCPTSWNF